jgi:hypothetical protein
MRRSVKRLNMVLIVSTRIPVRTGTSSGDGERSIDEIADFLA